MFSDCQSFSSMFNRSIKKSSISIRMVLRSLLSMSLMLLAGAFALPLDSAGQEAVMPAMEVASVTVAQENRDEWHTVSFDTAFSTVPVVVMGPPTYGGWDPSTILVRNVTTEGFEFQLREWEYLGGGHSEESLSYIALESGEHDLGGAKVISGRTTVSVGSEEDAVRIDFSVALDAAIVLAQSRVVGSEIACVARAIEVEDDGFSVMVQVEEDLVPATSVSAEVGWVALESGSADFGGMNMLVSRALVSSEWSEVEFTRTATDPMILATMQTVNEPDPASLRMKNLKETGVKLMVEEETSGDAETDHLAEEVGYVLFWEKRDPQLEVGEIEVESLSEGTWLRIDLEKQYEEPVVIVGPPTANSEEPVISSIRNVDSSGFEIRLHSWDYQKYRYHPSIHYVVRK